MAAGLLVVLGLVALVAGGVASVAGFGIGSLLTPTLAAKYPANVAVAAVSIPHVAATAYRFWLIRDKVNRKLLLSFGVMSAAGGLLGALLNSVLASRWLEVVLAILLLAVGIGGLFGWTKKLRFTGFWAWLAGGVSGFLGGLVGNQGGLRSGAMLGVGVSRDSFVATATAVGLIVDAARMPVYLAVRWRQLVPLWPGIVLMVAAALFGTWIGMRVLRRIPEKRFIAVVSVLLIGLGIWLLVKQ